MAAERKMFEASNLPLEYWTILVDGSSNSKVSGLGRVLISFQQTQIERAIRCGFKATNNEVEYRALIARLALENELRIKNLIVKSDSQLIINQFDGNFQTKEDRLEAYLKSTKDLALCFTNLDRC